MRRFGRISMRLGAVAIACSLVGAVPTVTVAALGVTPCVVTDTTPKHPRTYATFADAVAGARAGHRLTVKGVCAANVTIGKDLTIVGVRPKGAVKPTLDGGSAGMVLLIVDGADVAISKLTITNGSNGAIYVNPGTLTLRDVRVTGNTGTWGAGITADDSTLRLLGRTSIDHNSVIRGGGGIELNGGALLLADRASIHHNSAGEFGAAINGGGLITLRDRASIHHNDGTAAGDDAYDYTGGSAVEIWAYDDPPSEAVTRLTLRDDARIRDNTAATNGGGIFVWTACGSNVPTVKGAKGRVMGNTPTQIVHYDDPSAC